MTLGGSRELTIINTSLVTNPSTTYTLQQQTGNDVCDLEVHCVCDVIMLDLLTVVPPPVLNKPTAMSLVGCVSVVLLAHTLVFQV